MGALQVNYNFINAVWGLVVLVVCVVSAAGFHACSSRADFITNEANIRTMKANAEIEANKQALRLECQHARRLWMQDMCIPSEPSK